jgi:hypothetical protein
MFLNPISNRPEHAEFPTGIPRPNSSSLLTLLEDNGSEDDGDEDDKERSGVRNARLQKLTEYDGWAVVEEGWSGCIWSESS